MKPAPFAYARPDDVAKALALLADHGEEARVLAGGQSLVAMLNLRLATPSVIVDINGLRDLSAIAPSPQGLVTGALVRHATALADPLVARGAPLLALALPHVGHVQTRSRGTLGGSLAHADPSAEVPLASLVANGAVELRSRRGTRVLKAAEFLTGPMTTARRPDELVTRLIWPAPSAGQRHGFAEFALRGGDYALVAVAAACELDAAGHLTTLRLGLGGVGDCPLLVDSSSFIGQPAGQGLAKLIAEAAAAIPARSDLHASAAYRSRLAFSLTNRVMRDLMGLGRNGAGG